jgi:alpha-galactosidase
LTAKVRICIVGGGSYNWSPILLQDFAASPELSVTIVLHDLNVEAAEELCRLGRRLMSAAGSDFAVEAIADQREALRDADFVIVTITTGGLEAMRHDLEIPLRYGIVQTVGDTVGPGGLARTLRNVPVFAGLARTMEEVCPDAWLVNITNPMAACVRAVTKTSAIKTVGLCHEMFGIRRVFTEIFNASPDEIELQIAGTNHLTWVLGASVGGEDGLALLRRFVANGGTIPVRRRTEEHMRPFEDHWRVKLALFDIYGYLPAAGDRHVAEFFPYFMQQTADGDTEPWVLPTMVEHRQAMAGAARDKVRAWLAGESPLPVGRSHEEVVDVVRALATGTPHTIIANLPNRGQIDNLPREAVVETRAVVMANGIQPVSVGALPTGVLTTIQQHVANQELIVEAALTGDRTLALQAFLSDPLVRDFRSAPRLVDELIEANIAYLPRFLA